MAKQLKAMTTIPGYRDVTSSSNMMAHNQLLIPDTGDLILSLQFLWTLHSCGEL